MFNPSSAVGHWVVYAALQMRGLMFGVRVSLSACGWTAAEVSAANEGEHVDRDQYCL